MEMVDEFSPPRIIPKELQPLKSGVFENNPRIIKQLKVNTEIATGNIKEVTLQKLAQNTIIQVKHCREEAGYTF